MIIGDSPNRDDVRSGKILSGRNGNLLESTLKSLIPGYRRSMIYFATILACRSDGKSSTSDIESCRDRLYEEIRRVKPKKILLLGSTASKAIQLKSVTQIRGLGQMLRLVDMDIYVLSTYHPSAILQDTDLFRDFASDIEKWVKNDRPVAAPKMIVEIPTDLGDALDCLDLLFEASAVSCDLETTGFNPRVDQILSIGFGARIESDPESTYNVIIPKELVNEPLIDRWMQRFFSTFQGDIAFHNIKFDFAFLRTRYGRDFSAAHLWDTLLMRYAQDERGMDGEANRSYGSLGLKDIARVRFDIPDYGFDFKEFFSTPEEERDWVSFYRYQAIDTHNTIRLFWQLRDELEEESPRLLPLVHDLLVPGALALCNMELQGCLIDREYLLELRESTISEVEGLQDRLREIVGNVSLNPNSPKQIKEIFESRGIPFESGEKEVLQLMAAQFKNHPTHGTFISEFVPLLLEFRQRSKVLKTYVEGLLTRIDIDGRVHSTFRVHGTDTGRMSSRDPNLQNIPTIMGPQIKRAFVAPPGWLLVNADYSQLELRVTAFMSRDPNLMEAYQKGVDVHRWVASFTFDKPIEEITSFERYMAKYIDFGVLYGRSANGLTEGFEAEYIFEMTGSRPTLEWANEIQKKFFDGFPTLKQFIDSQHAFVRRHQYIESPTGRRRRFPLIDRTSVGSTERKSVNTPIQGSASDMALNSMIHLDRRLDPNEAYTICTVHDSIMFYIREDVLDKNLAIIREVMETPVIPNFDVPLRVDIGYGTDWSKAKD